MVQFVYLFVLQALEALAKAGCRRLDVVCPGFAADCLETLEEVQTEAANYFAGFTVSSTAEMQ